jgi:hypothetical protein
MKNNGCLRSCATDLYHEEDQIEIDHNARRRCCSLAKSRLSWRRSACGTSKALTPLIRRCDS